MNAAGTSKAVDLIHHPVPPAGLPPRRSHPVFKAGFPPSSFPPSPRCAARDWKHKTGYTYGLHGTPTTFTLEERIATLEGGKHCLLVPSGLAAMAWSTWRCSRPATRCCCPTTPTAPARAWPKGELPNWGITHRFYDAMDPADLAAKLGPENPAGVAGGAGLGHAGIPRHARAGRGRQGARMRTPRHRDRARQHLGRRPGLQRL
jgi:cystathionine beta-lyase